MKLYVLSDLHLEFAEFDPEPAALEACDVVVLAGDIAHGTEALAWASASCGTKPVIYVAGNHEFYGQDWSELLQQLRAQAADLGIHFLEDDEVQVQGVRFLGGSLWTNFEYFPERPRAVAMRRAQWALNDYRAIRAPAPRLAADGDLTGVSALLRPEHTLARHAASRQWLEQRLRAKASNRTVVVTHHAPSASSVPAEYRDDEITPAFASRLDDLVIRCDVWIHGHTHSSFDYELSRGDGTHARVICNPRGYPRYRMRGGGWIFENQAFCPDLLVDVS